VTAAVAYRLLYTAVNNIYVPVQPRLGPWFLLRMCAMSIKWTETSFPAAVPGLAQWRNRRRHEKALGIGGRSRQAQVLAAGA